jgi:methyl-accepting chemotaxis protein
MPTEKQKEWDFESLLRASILILDTTDYGDTVIAGLRVMADGILLTTGGVESTDEIANLVHNGLKKIKELRRERGLDLARVDVLIKEVGDHANSLSENAGIEGWRCGDLGKCFSSIEKTVQELGEIRERLQKNLP